MRVLVTGQNGFTGRYVVRALVKRGHQVLPFDADIKDERAVSQIVRNLKPEGFIHLAAKAFVHSEEISDFYLVNQIGSFYLLQAAAQYAPKSPFLLASSANIYGNTASGYVSEDSPANPANHYAASKLAMEIGARFWADRLSITTLRAFNYTGIGQEAHYVIPKIIKHFRERAPIIELGNINIRRDFGDVRSVAEVYADLLQENAGMTLNICTGRLTSLSDIIQMCTDLTGHRPAIVVNPSFVRKNDVEALAGDPAKLRRALPKWQPHEIESTIAWMLAAADTGLQ
jgi:nucleoside-diphosphate-sugar epimerase